MSNIFTPHQRATALQLLESRNNTGNNSACRRLLEAIVGSSHIYQNVLLELMAADALIDRLTVRLENPLSDSIERERHPSGTV